MDTTKGLSDAAAALEQLWGSGERPDLHTFLEGRPTISDEELLAVIRVDHRRRALAGQAVGADTYLALLPTAGCSRGAALASEVRDLIRQEGELPPLPSDDFAVPVVEGYEVIRRLGQGGMGTVFLAQDRVLGRLVAIKTIRADYLDAPDARARFETEAVAAARLQHPNIVQVFGTGRGTIHGAPMPFLALEYVEGQSLGHVLAGKPQAPRWCAELLARLARAAHHAHEKGIVHRDLKPNNVLVAPDGTPKVTDFGLAKILDREDVTRAGAIFGTRRYMSPEQTAGGRIGPATDVWSLGVILYEVLTGRLPFLGQTEAETFAQIREFEPVAPSALQPAVPRDLETIALARLRKPVERRYGSCGELADDLERYMRGEAIRARPPGPAERAVRFLRRHAILAASSAAVFATLAGALVVVALALLRARADRPFAEGETRKAVAAEQEQARLAARGHLRLALLHRQQGRWQPALDALEAARLGGHPEPARVRLEKIQVLVALNRDAEAKRELHALRDDPDAAAHSAQAMLWDADLLLGEDTAKATRLIREAAATGKLSPAETAYARGLLAERAPDAVVAFGEALDSEPLHLRANQMQAFSLMVLGRLDEADRRLLVARANFPRDPNLLMIAATLSALRGEKAQLSKHLAALAPEIDSRQAKRINAVLGLLASELPRFEFWCWEASGLDSGLLLLRVMPLLGHLPSGGGKADSLRLPPFFAAQGSLLLDLASPLKRQQAIARLPKLLADHPEGFFAFIHARSLVEAGRLREAEAALDRATRLPAMIPVRRSALSLLAITRAELYDKAEGTERQRLGAGLRQTLREVLEFRGPDIPLFRKAFVGIASKLCEVDLARRFVVRWLEAAPKDRAGRLAQGWVERHGTAHDRAEKIARELLAERPDDAAAKELLEATQKGRGKDR